MATATWLIIAGLAMALLLIVVILIMRRDVHIRFSASILARQLQAQLDVQQDDLDIE